MAENPELVGGVQVMRMRSRVDSLSIDKEKIAKRVIDFYDQDNMDRGDEVEARLQRYAKFRQWREGKDWPWPNATDSAIPDMMTQSMRLQDTLHNAVMTQRPPIQAKSVKEGPNNDEREEKINHLLDWQFFEEQPGETTVGQLADDFVNEGFYQAYVPWIKETRYVEMVKVHDPIPQGIMPIDYFSQLVQGEFPEPGTEIVPSKDGWDWKITLPEEKQGVARKRGRVSFFTKPNGEVEMDTGKETTVYDGPRAIRKAWQDVGHPVRCENLQIKSPSNPTGASHVWLRDYPNVDEVKRLYHSGFYDLMTKEDAEKLGILDMDTANQESEEQKDAFAGKDETRKKPDGAESHKTLTRLMFFDCFDINKDGLDEDVIWWVLVEPKIVLRAKYLTQMFPLDPPRRPLAEAALFPVPGRRDAIGLLEMMEGMHDLMKQYFDQGGDAGTLENAMFGFYRAASNMRPEVLSLQPGELYPLTDPKNDIYFPPRNSGGQAFTFNMLTVLQTMEEKLTNIGDLQLGRVPQGKASALRTVSGMQTVLSQGDARPERVLRRFFIGLTQIWELFHGLNEFFMPEEKLFKLCGYLDPRKNPYVAVKKSEIKGKFLFTFSQNALNTSKEALQQALDTMIGLYVTPMAIQLGISTPDGIYRLLRDRGRAAGPDPDKYINPPTPMALMGPPISWEDAVVQIMDGVLPQGTPQEGGEIHFQKLIEFMQSDQFGHLQPEFVPVFQAYLSQVQQFIAQQRMALAQAAGGMEAGGDGKPGPEGSPQPGAQTPAPVAGNELMDETLPSAGGGGNAGVYA